MLNTIFKTLNLPSVHFHSFNPSYALPLLLCTTSYTFTPPCHSAHASPLLLSFVPFYHKPT